MASIYNLLYLRNLVKKKLQNDPFFSDNDIDDAINEAQDDLAIFSHVNVADALQQTVLGQVEYPVPTDSLQAVGANFDGFEMDEMTYEEWRRKGGFNSIQTQSLGDPSEYYSRSNQFIGLFPTPGSVKDLRIFYIPKPVDLVLDTDVPIIPRVYTQAIVYYAAYKMFENDAKTLQEATYHFRIYQDKRAEHTVSLAGSEKRKFRNTTSR